MRKQIAKQIAAYWRASRRVTFETSDKQDVYGLLGRADALIGALACELVRLEEASNGDLQKEGDTR